MSSKELWPSMYETKDLKKKVRGKGKWVGPEECDHAEDTLVALFKSEKDSDGQDVELYVCMMPAMFTELRVLETPNSVGEVQHAYRMTTGSGDKCFEWGVMTAQLISQGMIGVRGNKEQS